MRAGVAFLVVVLLCATDGAARADVRKPADVGMDGEILAGISDIVATEIKAGSAPGVVVLVLRQGAIVFRSAYGQRATQPTDEKMAIDTVFDLASLTKPVATATAIWLLIERGLLRLSDPVARHLPPFGQHGKENITVEQLLLHTSGLIADNALKDYQAGRQKAIENIYDLKLTAKPGERFIYSDVGFIVLGELVAKLSGLSLDAFAQKEIFAPLGMRDTTFRPGKDLVTRCAPTQRVEEKWLRGEVHDPRARLMGGVAGHAGLFGTADDLAVYARMLLDGGESNGKRLLAADTMRLMTTARPVPRGKRTPGWDAQTSFSGNRGEFFGGFGHTGFTGTSLWIDPTAQTAVIVLTNRVHPDGKGNVTRLRSRIATQVARSIIRPPFPDSRVLPVVEGRASPVLTGIDVLQREKFKPLVGKRVALVTNHTGVDRDGNSTIDLLHKAAGVKLTTLFSPEHGIRGALDKPVPDGKDEKTGLPVYSLYGKNRRPTAEQLANVDAIVYDIQDIGCRFYTYATTLGYVLEEAAKHKLPVHVLDRPNPIGGLIVEGPVLDKKAESFVAYHTMPVRHGMTLGELALLFNTERKINATLDVVKLEGWRREDLFDATGLMWVNPSPNMRSLAAALLYPGIGLLETTDLSVGRGTDRPFELLGAPWLDGRKLAAELNKSGLRGVRFVPTRFAPSSSKHAGKECGGVQLYVSDWSRFESLPTGFAVAAALLKTHPREWRTDRYNVLLGHAQTLKALNDLATWDELIRLGEAERKAFLKVRARYLLY